MRCAMCDRLMLTAAVSIPTRGGAVVYGPKCAERAGLLPRHKRGPQIIRRRGVQRVEADQVDWVNAAQAA